MNREMHACLELSEKQKQSLEEAGINCVRWTNIIEEKGTLISVHDLNAAANILGCRIVPTSGCHDGIYKAKLERGSAQASSTEAPPQETGPAPAQDLIQEVRRLARYTLMSHSERVDYSRLVAQCQRHTQTLEKSAEVFSALRASVDDIGTHVIALKKYDLPWVLSNALGSFLAAQDDEMVASRRDLIEVKSELEEMRKQLAAIVSSPIPLPEEVLTEVDAALVEATSVLGNAATGL